MTDSRQRDKRGRFIRGNTIASAGGQARAQALTPQRRRAIARQARRRMVERHFGGDDGQQRRYFAELGRYAYEAQAGSYRARSPLRTAVRHPGPIQDWRARQMTFSLFDAINQDVVF